MAGTYAPIITNYPNGVVSITSTSGTSYEQIRNSMGSYLYEIEQMYVKTNSTDQLFVPLLFNQYDVNGTLQSFNQIMTVNPYQYQSATFFDLTQGKLVLNGRTSLSTTILPNEDYYMVIYAEELSNKSLLKGKDMFDQDDFYTDYKEVLDGKEVEIENPIMGKIVNVSIKEDMSIPKKNPTTPSLPKLSQQPKVSLITNNNLVKSKETFVKNSTYWIYVIGAIAVLAYLNRKN